MVRQYSFGGRDQDVRGGAAPVAPQPGTKVCPRCGSVLFEDMDVCYGCLYDFSNPAEGFIGLPDPEAGPLPEPRVAGCPAPSASSPAQVPAGTPRDEQSPQDPERTLALGEATGPGPALRLRSPDVEVTLPVGEGGLSFGRGADNDVRLPARTVSREHLRVVVRGGELMAFDQGATNPALLNGEPIEGGVRLEAGDVVAMGEVSVVVEAGA